MEVKGPASLAFAQRLTPLVTPRLKYLQGEEETKSAEATLVFHRADDIVPVSQHKESRKVAHC